MDENSSEQTEGIDETQQDRLQEQNAASQENILQVHVGRLLGCTKCFPQKYVKGDYLHALLLGQERWMKGPVKNRRARRQQTCACCLRGYCGLSKNSPQMTGSAQSQRVSPRHLHGTKSDPTSCDPKSRKMPRKEFRCAVWRAPFHTAHRRRYGG